ncbi:MAG: peptidoglycan DL-endopeptidase CwlO [Micromonosporaceae bacterium]|jgi:cell wall-associated NlpC family hydrolase|nr:peptidoglycan DL-endopeptidase CwlO [Micromonosporaceae bacterium]
MLYGAIAVAVVAPAAAANAAPSAKDLQQQVDQANANFEKIVEQYNGVGERLKATQAEADALTAKMAPLQSQMDAAYASVGEIAVRAYKGGAMTPMAALLSGSPSAGLIDELTSLDHLARVRQADIDAFTRTKTQFDDQRKALENLLNTERTDQKNLADQKAKIEADLVNLTALQKKAAAATGSSGTSGSGTSKAPPAAPNIGGGAGTAVRFAYGALGKPYVFAAAGPSSFDCSGLTMAAWRAAGRSLPHNAAMQWSAVAHISSSQLQPGDLVFYSGLSHVAIYIGSGSVIHAPHTGTVVQVASVNMMTPYGYGRVR